MMNGVDRLLSGEVVMSSIGALRSGKTEISAWYALSVHTI